MTMPTSLHPATVKSLKTQDEKLVKDFTATGNVFY